MIASTQFVYNYEDHEDKKIQFSVIDEDDGYITFKMNNKSVVIDKEKILMLVEFLNNALKKD